MCILIHTHVYEIRLTYTTALVVHDMSLDSKILGFNEEDARKCASIRQYHTDFEVPHDFFSFVHHHLEYTKDAQKLA